MGIFDIENEYEEMGQDERSLDEDEALALIGRLFAREKPGEGPDFIRLASCLKDSLPDILGNAALENQQQKEIYARLEHFGAACLENCRLPMLRGKPVVGIGGAYSAGKSRFLNSITGLDNLPEDQGPTTAIGTYLLHGDEFTIQAHTKSNSLQTLDSHELQAISHKFHNRYQIGFADILHKLIIRSPLIRPDLVLLDTPGYSKADAESQINTGERPSDWLIAHDHLKNSDFLIWLIEIEAGIIPASDLAFLESLELRAPFLVIFNKSDKKSNEVVSTAIKGTEALLKSSGLPIYGVTAYSSFSKKEFGGRSLITDYLDEAAKARPFSDLEELAHFEDVWQKSFDIQKREVDGTLATIEKAIVSSSSASSIQGLLQTHFLLGRKSSRLYYDKKIFDAEMENFRGKLGEFL